MLILLIDFVNYESNSQNLIRNNSFEIIDTPATWNNWVGGFINYSEWPEKRILFDWDEFNSADLLTSACNHTFASVPANRFGNIYAKDGNNVVGFNTVYNDNNESKEYIYQQLSSPLQAGKVYCLSFWVSRADRISYAIKSIGAYFSNNVQSVSIGYINATPQVVHQGGFITDTIGWTKIEGCFTAQGGEEYITIGNFNSNANTDTLRIQPVNALSTTTVDIAYYYIDDIQLWDALTTGIEDLQGNTFNVYPNPANDVVTIKGNSDIEKAEITNVAGQILLSEQINQREHQLKLNDFEDGIYFVRIIYSNGLRVTRKIVISH